jgi:hypothetical protein
MSDVDAGAQPDTGDAGEGTSPPAEVTKEDMISRGKGMSLQTVNDLPVDSPAAQAVVAFKELQGRYLEAEQAFEGLKEDRNKAIYDLKANHDVGFSAIAEFIGGTSSLVLYLYERSQGKSAKQIREESQRSSAAKAEFRETDPNRKPVRKQTPAEKELRARQREELKQFLASQADAGEGEPVDEADIQEDDA